MPDYMPEQSGSDSVLLDFLRRKRLDEEKRNVGLVGKGFSTGATAGDVSSLENDINEAPDTGVAAQKAVSDVESRMAGEAAFNSPGATDVRAQKQKDKLAELLAVPQAQGANALALEQERNKGALKLQQGSQDFTREFAGGGTPNEAGGQGFVPSVNPQGGVSLKGIAPHKTTTEEQRALDTMGSLASLGPEMLRKYEAEYPGIEKDPTKYAGLLDVLGGRVGAAAYKTGYMSNSNSDQLTQLTGYLEAVLPRMLSSGRINKEQYLDLKLHVPQVGLPAGSNYERARYVLDRILPAVKGAIGTTPGGLDQQDPYANPDYRPK